MKMNRLRRRRGAAVIEAAIALPVVLIIILGTVEVCNGIFLKQSMLLMAFEGARVAIIPEATADDVAQQINEMGEERGIAIDTVEVLPSDFASTPMGTFIEVVVTSKAQQPGKTQFFSNAKSSVSVFIMKE